MTFDPTTAEHPERKPNEVFLGNFTTRNYEYAGYKTRRRGIVAYMADGNQYHMSERWRISPVFCERTEYEANLNTGSQFVTTLIGTGSRPVI